MDYSLPGTSVHGIFQARMLEWVAFYFSRESSQPKDWTHIFWVVGRFFTAGSLRKPLPNLIVTCPLSTSARSNSSMHPSFFSTFRKNPSAEENIHKSNPSHWELALEAAKKKKKEQISVDNYLCSPTCFFQVYVWKQVYFTSIQPWTSEICFHHGTFCPCFVLVNILLLNASSSSLKFDKFNQNLLWWKNLPYTSPLHKIMVTV